MKTELLDAMASERIAAGDVVEAKLLAAKIDIALGAKESAVGVLEDVLVSTGLHSENNKLAEEARAALREALTTVQQRRSVVPGSKDGEYAPIAVALAQAFPVKGNAMTVKLITFGGRSVQREKDSNATFEVGAAARAKASAECPLCTPLGISTHASRHGDWTGMFEERSAIEDALVVYYYDLGSNKVPARYDSALPLPTNEIDAELEKGNGLIAVKQRSGQPPIVLLAAPRNVQLRAVEAKFAEMTALPETPVSVKVSDALTSDEIQSVIRSGFKGFKDCYEALLQRTPQAAGTFEFEFTVAKGMVKSPRVTSKDASLREEGFLGCVTQELRALEFPKTRKDEATTVRYPITVRP